MIEELIKKYGEENRKLITKAIEWILEQQKTWQLEDFNYDNYIKNILDYKTKGP